MEINIEGSAFIPFFSVVLLFSLFFFFSLSFTSNRNRKDENVENEKEASARNST